MTKTKKSSKRPEQELTPFGRYSWSEMDKVFDNFRRDIEKSLSSFPSFTIPNMPKLEASCDVVDEGKQFQIQMDLPGVKKNEIKLNVTDNSVEISAEHKEEKEDKKKNFLRKERNQISYYRTIPLSEKIVSGKTKAKLTDGVLTITLPKSKPTMISKKKPISVQ